MIQFYNNNTLKNKYKASKYFSKLKLHENKIKMHVLQTLLHLIQNNLNIF